MENPLIYGTMSLGKNLDHSPKKSLKKATKAIEAALSIDIKTFDFANIYQDGKSEKVFGKYLKRNPSIRKKIKIQSKVGIELNNNNPWKNKYNFSSNHLVKEVYSILERLNVDYLDSLLLHRYDPIFELEELSEAINKIKNEGLVKKFGVSNMNHHQIKLLQKITGIDLKINQIEMNLSKLDWLDDSILFNNDQNKNTNLSSGTLEFCFLNDIDLQAWSSLAGGIFSGRKLNNPSKNILKTKKLVTELANKKGISKEGIVLAFILKHPFKIRPLIGTTNPERIKNTKDALDVNLSREQWYDLYVNSRGKILP
ncbi:MAG: aldo/keto reductase [Bacillota bacterium]